MKTRIKIVVITLTYLLNVSAYRASAQVIVVSGSSSGITVNSVLRITPDPKGTVTYRWRDINDWIADLNEGLKITDSDLYIPTDSTVEVAETLWKCIPLLTYVADPDNHLISQGWTEMDEFNPDYSFKRVTTRALHEVIQKAVPTLVYLMKNYPAREVREAASRALDSEYLGRIGEFLKRKNIEGKKIELNNAIIKVLHDLLLERLKSKVEVERREAVILFGSKFPELAVIVVPELIKLLQGSVTDYRLNAIEALENLESAAQAAIPVLSEAVNDSNKEIRKKATRALNRITKAIKDAQKRK